MDEDCVGLHVGCGDHVLHGWLNTDLEPRTGVEALDATNPFPFSDATFPLVFTEHLIEHITFAEGLAMLKECRRVLKPGGRIRVATPDFKFLLELYHGGRGSRLQRRYLRWAAKRWCGGAPPKPIFVINNFMRDWGHQFIYDAETLEGALAEAGFSSIERCAIGESAVPELRGLENVERLPEGFLELETMVFEAVVPG